MCVHFFFLIFIYFLFRWMSTLVASSERCPMCRKKFKQPHAEALYIARFSEGPGRSRSRTLSLPRLMDFIQGHVRDVMTPLFFPPIRSNVTYSQKSGILENRA